MTDSRILPTHNQITHQNEDDFTDNESLSAENDPHLMYWNDDHEDHLYCKSVTAEKPGKQVNYGFYCKTNLV